MLILIFLALDMGEKEIVDALFAQQREKMYNISYKILDSPQDAEDAIGDAFIKIIDNFTYINKLPCHEMVPFCVVIVKNCCIAILRKRKKALPIEPTVMAELSDTVGLTAEDDYFRVENAALLASLMTKLSPADRQLLRLRYMDELSYHQIGALLDINEVAARKREQRALQRLRTLYTKEGEA